MKDNIIELTTNISEDLASRLYRNFGYNDIVIKDNYITYTGINLFVPDEIRDFLSNISI
jgi:hypothetical protein